MNSIETDYGTCGWHNYSIHIDYQLINKINGLKT